MRGLLFGSPSCCYLVRQILIGLMVGPPEFEVLKETRRSDFYY